MAPLTRHLNPDPDTPPVQPPADPGWLAVSAAFTAHLPRLADRDDLIAVVEPGAAAGNPACYLPLQATIEIDGALLAPHPSALNPPPPGPAPFHPVGFDPADPRETYPVAWGALIHEAAHARHTGWDFGAGQPAAAEAAILLEETRIEAAQLARRPGDRRWLRAAVTKLLLADIPDTDDPWTAGTAAALVCARVDAGVLHPDEARPLRTVLRRVLGPRRLTQLGTIWRQAHRVADHDTTRMLNLGRRWCQILGIDPAADPTQQPAPAAGGSTAAGPPGAVRQAAGKVTAAVAADAAAEVAADQQARQAAAARAAARAAGAGQQAANQTAAATVFGPPAGGTGGSSGTGGRPRSRPPTADEQAAARQLARALRAAAHREPTTTHTTSPTPPGRLSTRAAVAADAQRAAGQTPTAEPWQRVVRRHTPQPPIHVGICADVSSSMTAWAEPVAAAAWITAQATAWAGGTSATVTFGARLTPVTRPGQPPQQVQLFDDEPDTRGFPTALDALDHTLGLTDPGAGARLLVIASDGQLLDTERSAGQTRLDRLAAAGCALLWLAPPGATPLRGPQVVTLDQPAQAGLLIARAATTVLNRHP